MSNPAKTFAALSRANRLYHALGSGADTGLTDEQYDSLKRELEKQSPDLVAKLGVGSEQLNATFSPVTHPTFIGSLRNAMNLEEFDAWAKGIDLSDVSMVSVSPKIDGLSLVLTYDRGELVHAVTRGNGKVGEDVTGNALRVSGIPKVISVKAPAMFQRRFVVRGEVFLSWSAFACVNEQLVKDGEEAFKNPRNAAVGMLGRKDGHGCEHLAFLAHGVVEPVVTKVLPSRLLRLLEDETGIPSVMPQVVPVAKVPEIFKHYRTVRATDSEEFVSGRSLPYAVDGLVISVDDAEARKQLGESSGCPKWAVALKFPPIVKQSVVRQVDWQLGDGGNLTPVARIDPVDINGATVSNVTLHNVEQIDTLDVAIGDTVDVTRSGDVIPMILQVIKKPKGRKPIELPTVCPTCGQKVGRRTNSDGSDSVFIACVNPDCYGNRRGMVMRWIKSLEIKEIGDEILDALMSDGEQKTIGRIAKKTRGRPYVRNIADLYTLREEVGVKHISHLQLNGRSLGESMAEKILVEIDKTRTLTIDQILGSLSIPGLGKDRVKLIREAWAKVDEPKWPNALDNIYNWFVVGDPKGSLL